MNPEVGLDRSVEMAAFLEASAEALRAACTGQAERAAVAMTERFETIGRRAAITPARLPVCDWIAPAVAAVVPQRAALAHSFAAIERQLHWYRRASASEQDEAFWNGHANAVILGPGGLEQREDLWVGATIMAPGVRYSDHNHPPEEIYLSLTAGEWWNAQMDWTDPGPNGFIYNPPGISHAMRSGTGPFLALWYLPL